MPVTCVLSLVTSLTVGVTGDVVSFTSITFSSDLLPDGSVDVTLILSPPLNFLLEGDRLCNCLGHPLHLLILCHPVILLLPYFLLLFVPLTCGLSLVTSLTVGATGGVVSFTSITFSSDLFPDGSVDVTLKRSPPRNFLLEGDRLCNCLGHPLHLLTLCHLVTLLLPYFPVRRCLLLVCFHL